MSKKILEFLVMGVVVFSFCASQCHAGPVVTTKAAVAIDQARAALQAKEWVVYLTPEGGKATGETDVITFTAEDKVSSKNLLAQGYGDSNFRLTIASDGAVVWETMKVDKDNNLAFLRGELRGNEMVGSIYMKYVKGTTSTNYYSTSLAPAAPAVSEAPAATTTTTTTRRSRK